MTRTGKAIAAALLVGAMAAVAGGAAYGFWSTTGTGSAVATTGTLEVVTIEAATAADVGASKLQPGGTADVVVKVANPNTYAVKVTSIALTTGGVITGSGGTSTCATTGVTFTPPAVVADIAPGPQTIVLPGAASMSTASDSGCQGATFQIPVTLTVQA